MNSKLNNQEGMGVLGILIIFIMLGAFFLFGLRAFPLYTEYFSVKQAMSSVAAAKYENRNSIIKVRSLMEKNLLINNVYSFGDSKVRKERIKVKKDGSKRFLTVKYSISEHLFDKLDLTLRVDESIELTGK